MMHLRNFYGCLMSAACAAVILQGAVIAWAQAPALKQKALFVPPPRSIADITAFLDKEKSDPAKRAQNEAAAEAKEPPKADPAALKDFYYTRAQARAALGRPLDAAADSEKAVTYVADYAKDGYPIDTFTEIQYRNAGEYRKAIAVLERGAQKMNVYAANSPLQGRAFNINLRMANNLIYLGEINRAQEYAQRSERLLPQARSWPSGALYLSRWQADMEEARARINGARGRYAEAEVSWRNARALHRDAMNKSKSWPIPVRQSTWDALVDYTLFYEGLVKLGQGRLAEAEIDMRQALLSRLKATGKYHSDPAYMLALLASLFNEQGRHLEAESLIRAAIDIYRDIGFPLDGQNYVIVLHRLAETLFYQTRYSEAKDVFVELDELTKAWPRARSTKFRSGWHRVLTHYFLQDAEKGIALAGDLYAQDKAVKGENHPHTVLSRAMVAMGLALQNRDAEALTEFKAAIPVLVSVAISETDGEEATITLSRDRRLQSVVESYMALLARSDRPDRADESLRVADAIRSRSVSGALSAAAARAAARTPALAELARKEQDLQKQIVAQATLIGNMLAQPAEQRDAAALNALQKELDGLRAGRRAAKVELDKRFPQYASLLRPLPATAEDIRSVLQPDEALVSFYLGERTSFVWALPKAGPIAFAAIPLTAAQIEDKIRKLRTAFEHDAATVGEIPAFDVAGAHDLYRLLLQPDEAAWRPAKSLIVVTNGALGLLPLGLLPSEPAELKAEGEPYFAGYRTVPWLIRTHAVVSMPSASALRTLRTVVAPVAKRETFIGFGDPVFSNEQAKESTAPEPVATVAETRGIRIKLRASPQLGKLRSAKLGALPPLPDTADELKSIALALQADPTKVLKLGKEANESTVKSLDLSRFRILAFATHGLVAGDLDGLTQPALALTAPEVADVDGDGLLTAEEILALRLNADWVVLSACNTGAAAGAGAEAVSGLGRAFFYAGSRALLVTNWAVHSASARDLVTDIFRRQADDPKLSRSQALRQAMLALLDDGGAKDQAGKTLFAYAHPMFWAPYTIVGDGSAD
jgi:CHAT domain-containing protein/tetratricopeptide (TPR) repeat protein